MKRRIIYIAFFVLFLGLFFYASRGPNLSNALKKLILPELELATGRKFIAQKIYINILPLFIEMKGIKAFDENGDRILGADRVKGYIGLSGLLRKEIIIKRLVIKKPAIASDKERLEDIAENVKKYLATESKMPFKVVLKSVAVQDAALTFRDEGTKVKVNGLNADIIISEAPRVRLSARSVGVVVKGVQDLQGMVETYFTVKAEQIDLKSLKIISHKSEITTSGILGIDKLNGELRTEVVLLMESVKRTFGLKNRGEGKISAGGLIKFDDLKSGIGNIFIDLKLKGDLYLETLMELLAVEEKLRGDMSVEGSVKGRLKDLTGSGKATLVRGNLFSVDVDRLACKVTYSNGEMKFTEGNAKLYGGSASVDAMIRLPVVDYFTLKIGVRGVSSKGVFKLIEWDPHIPEGRVTGLLSSSGSEFNPTGNFVYTNAGVSEQWPVARKKPAAGKRPQTTGDILDRIKEIRGEFNTSGDVLSIPNILISAGKSNLSAKGSVDLAKKLLSFQGDGATVDVKEFSYPYFSAMSGPLKFSTAVSGTFKDPIVDLKFSSNKILLSSGELGIPDVLKNRTVAFNMVEGVLNYRKNLLTVKDLSGHSSKEAYRVSGNIVFPNARELFELAGPDYNLNISVSNINIKDLSEMFHDSPDFAGQLNADFRFYGRPDDLKASGRFRTGNFSVASVHGKYPFDMVEGKASYSNREFAFSSVAIKKGVSTLNADGTISLDKRFSISADGRNIKFSDIIPWFSPEKPAQQTGAVKTFYMNLLEAFSFTAVRIKGDGTFKDPAMVVDGDVLGGLYRGHKLGKGHLKGTLKGRNIAIDSSILDGKMNLKGTALLAGALPWTAKLELQQARYDFILANFLKDIPEDLLLNIKGNITASGDKDHIKASALLSRAHLFLYNHGFTNNSDIVMRLDDKKLSIETVTMKSDATEFTVGGNMEIGKSYDLLLEGSSSLSILKAISKTIDVIKGSASFVFSVSGDWEKPRINGGLDVSNGTLGFRNISYRLTNINAYIYMDEDSVIIERAGGKLSGGDVSLSGSASLKNFHINKFFLESRMKGINASVSKDFWVNFDGNLYYKGTLESQTILGDIYLKRARYSERIEWKSWLLKARPRERPRVEAAKLDRTSLNVKVTGSNLLIDNNVAKATVKMDILLRGTIGQPVFLGKVEAREGLVYFRNNEFKILKANVDFSSLTRVNPYFDIVAETRTKNYNVRLNLNGYVEQFNMSLSSDPPLSETDIFSLLTVGEIGKHLKGLEGGIGAGEATSFLTGKIQDVLEERVKTVTGFDRVQVDPYVSKITGTVTPRVTIAKRLMGDKLYVTYSTSVGTGEEQVWKLEYFLDRNISLIGLRDERGGIGGDVKFRFEFK